MCDCVCAYLQCVCAYMQCVCKYGQICLCCNSADYRQEVIRSVLNQDWRLLKHRGGEASVYSPPYRPTDSNVFLWIPY